MNKQDSAHFETNNFSCLVKIKNYREPPHGSIEAKTNEHSAQAHVPQTPGLDKKLALLNNSSLRNSVSNTDPTTPVPFDQF